MRHIVQHLYDHCPRARAGAGVLPVVVGQCLSYAHVLNNHGEYERDQGHRGSKRGGDKQRIEGRRHTDGKYESQEEPDQSGDEYRA